MIFSILGVVAGEGFSAGEHVNIVLKLFGRCGFRSDVLRILLGTLGGAFVS
ncbi:MAG: hypothetical protein M3315_09935 [Actinomycetota bacterium]|nr:hypothetical protein [Actinomycetota bacterium]MDQ3921100.1 hypothetical protein [Actinomycetota bacterium]